MRMEIRIGFSNDYGNEQDNEDDNEEGFVN